MNAIPIGIFAQAKGISGLNYWIATVDANSGVDLTYGVSSAPDGSIYLAGQYEVSSSPDSVVTKLSDSAVFSWASALQSTGTTENFQAVANDSSNNVFVIGQDANALGLLLQKHTSTGTQSWTRRLQTSGVESAGKNLSIDSSGNVIVTGISRVSSTNNKNQILVAKFDTSGTLTWQRRLGITTADSYGNSVTTDSSGNVYLSGQGSSNNTDILATIAKWNSSGTLQWHYWIKDNSVTASAFNDITLDSDGNIYAAGYVNSGSSRDAYLVKYNSSGTVQWQRSIGTSSFTDEFYNLNIYDNNLYAMGRTSTGSATTDREFLITKWDLSGNLVWQRSLGISGVSDFGYAGTVTSSGDIIIAGETAVTGTNSKTLIARLPSDGSLAGTYVVDSLSVTYGDPGLTVTTLTWTSSAGTLSGSTTTHTNTTLNPTPVTPTFTVSKTSI